MSLDPQLSFEQFSYKFTWNSKLYRGSFFRAYLFSSVSWEATFCFFFAKQREGFDRCKYGVLNAMNDHRGVVKCAQYGDSYLVLKDVWLGCQNSVYSPASHG